MDFKTQRKRCRAKEMGRERRGCGTDETEDTERLSRENKRENWAKV